MSFLQPRTGIPDINDCVRAEGFPLGVPAEEVLEFFEGLEVRPRGVLRLKDEENKMLSDIIVVFKSPEVAMNAFEKDGSTFNDHTITLKKVTKPELYFAAGFGTMLDPIIERDNMIRLSSLPENTSPDQIKEQFPGIALDYPGIWVVNLPKGKPAGEAFLAFKKPGDADDALETAKRVKIGDNEVVAQRCKRWDLYFALNRLPQEHMRKDMRPPHDECVRFRNLPISVTREDLLNFLGEYVLSRRHLGLSVDYVRLYACLQRIQTKESDAFSGTKTPSHR